MKNRVNYFFYSKFLLVCFLQFFFIKFYKNHFPIEIITIICPWNCIFNFADYKNLFWPIWSIFFSKSVFVFCNSYMITNFKFGMLIVNFLNRLNMRIIFNINRFRFTFSMICVVLFIYYVM